MELHREIAYAEAEFARISSDESKFFHSCVLFKMEDQVRYDTDYVFRERYCKANLQFLWAFVAEQEAAKKFRPQYKTHNSFSAEKGKSKFQALLRR